MRPSVPGCVVGLPLCLVPTVALAHDGDPQAPHSTALDGKINDLRALTAQVVSAGMTIGPGGGGVNAAQLTQRRDLFEEVARQDPHAALEVAIDRDADARRGAPHARFADREVST